MNLHSVTVRYYANQTFYVSNNIISSNRISCDDEMTAMPIVILPIIYSIV